MFNDSNRTERNATIYHSVNGFCGSIEEVEIRIDSSLDGVRKRPKVPFIQSVACPTLDDFLTNCYGKGSYRTIITPENWTVD